MGYECYIFAWKNYPKGGANDLIGCYDTVEEGKERAEQLSMKYHVVQLMRRDGEKIEST